MNRKPRSGKLRHATLYSIERPVVIALACKQARTNHLGPSDEREVVERESFVAESTDCLVEAVAPMNGHHNDNRAVLDGRTRNGRPRSIAPFRNVLEVVKAAPFGPLRAQPSADQLGIENDRVAKSFGKQLRHG